MIVLTSLGAEGELIELLTLGQGPVSALSVSVADPPLLPAPQIGLNGSEPVEMVLLPAGHAAGLYLLLRVLVRRSLGIGGAVLQTLSYSAPLFGPVVVDLPPELLIGDAGPMVIAPVPFFSSGETAVVLATAFGSLPVSPLVLDLYAAAR